MRVGRSSQWSRKRRFRWFASVLSPPTLLRSVAIDGVLVDGFTLILRRGLFSSDITLRDGIDNLNIGSDFLMDVDNDQIWLVRRGANWNQLTRVEALP